MQKTSTGSFFALLFISCRNKIHETDKFNDHIASTVHLAGPESLLIARMSKSLEDMTASVERYMSSRHRFPSSPTLILKAEDPPDVNAFRIIAHEILNSQFKDLAHGTAQFPLSLVHHLQTIVLLWMATRVITFQLDWWPIAILYCGQPEC